jgi:TPR repeat protein
VHKGGSGAGAGASAGNSAGKEDGEEEKEEEEECAICLEALSDPLAPCAEQPSHRYCRGCVQEMQKQKLPSCPLCRGKMQDAEELFYEWAQLRIRAKKAPTPAQRDALHAKEHDMLHRVLRVDPLHIKAQYNLGIMYQRGEGVQQVFKQAAAWYRKTADQGLADAQCSLGIMYDEGQGVQQDFKQAVSWYRKAAEQGDAAAQYLLGSMYDKGQGVQQDYKQAALWFQKAAEQGYATAQHNLGSMYRKGEGVQQDNTQAAALYRKAAEQGNAEAQYNLGIMYRQGQAVQQDDTQAAALYRKAADQGHTMAHLGLGELNEGAGDYQAAFASYRAGQVVYRDLARAGMRRCLEKMADSREKDQDAVPGTK